MKRLLLFLILAGLTAADAQAQRYMTRSGRISFFSSTPLENIEAINNEASCVMDAANGDVVMIVPIKSFRFEKALMQEHFNENYMESDQYPKSEFRGKIRNPGSVNFGKDGSYPVTVSGKLTIHGVTRSVSAPGTITVKSGEATAASKFQLRPADYGIKIPSLVAGKIAKEIEVTVNCVLTKR